MWSAERWKEQRAEQRMLRDLRRGDPAAFAAFVDAYGPTVHRLSRRYARTEADAEDLTQEAFVALSGALTGFRGDARLSTWVYRVALNHCLKHATRRRPEPLPLDDTLPLADASPDGSPHQWTARRELGRRLDDALADLSEGHREVVILHELHGLTYAECAAVLEIPVGTVKSRLFHAFARLRERLGAYVAGEEETHPHGPGDGDATGRTTRNGVVPRAAVAAAAPLTETRP